MTGDKLYKSDFMKIMRERGFLHQCTDESGLDAKLKAGKTTAYIGFDCTASSLHVGSLIQIMVLRWLKNTGHNPIVLLGGATTKIGDPSGKDESRPPLSDEVIEENKAGIAKNFEQFGLSDCTFVDNSEWLQFKDPGYMEFLAKYGRYFSINRMMTMDSVKLRLEREQHLSFLEFNYMILQAYDFVELNRRYGCSLQIGGSDQWGNIVGGIELSDKANGKIVEFGKGKGKYLSAVHTDQSSSLFGLTTPLITTADGKKMGKTAAGAVWLNPEMLSPYDYWQFWRNTNDNDVERFLKFFTELELPKIKEIMAGNINDAKKILATEATALCHGKQAALNSAETAKKTFEEGKLGESLPVFEIEKALLQTGTLNTSSLAQMAGLSVSIGEAKRLIQGKGLKINDQTVELQPVTLKDLNSDGVIKLSAGKKKHIIVKPV